MRPFAHTKLALVTLLVGCGGELVHEHAPTAGGADAGPEVGLDADPAARDAALKDDVVVRPSPTPPREDACSDDSECLGGRMCYGDVASGGTFGEPYCRQGCLNASDYTRYCLSDSNCCEGLRCCVGCGEREGVCVVP